MLLTPFLYSCAATTGIIVPQTGLVFKKTGVDLSRYTEAGFLITSLEYNGDYEALSVINFQFEPSRTKYGAKSIADYLIMNEGQSYNPDYYMREEGYWVINEEWSLNDAMEKTYKYCLSIGADALVSFDFSTRVERLPTGEGNRIQTMDILQIKGLAIKRKGAFK